MFVTGNKVRPQTCIKHSEVG